MCLSKTKTAPVVMAAPIAEEQDPQVTASRDTLRLRKRQQASQTLLTGPSGLIAPATTEKKTLLGA